MGNPSKTDLGPIFDTFGNFVKIAKFRKKSEKIGVDPGVISHGSGLTVIDYRSAVDATANWGCCPVLCALRDGSMS